MKMSDSAPGGQVQAKRHFGEGWLLFAINFATEICIVFAFARSTSFPERLLNR